MKRINVTYVERSTFDIWVDDDATAEDVEIAAGESYYEHAPDGFDSQDIKFEFNMKEAEHVDI